MSFEMEEKLTIIGGVVISFATCAWFCVNQHKLTKNTGRIADVLEKDFEDEK